MGSRSYKKHKKLKHSKRNKHHMRRKTRKMRGGGIRGGMKGGIRGGMEGGIRGGMKGGIRGGMEGGIRGGMKGGIRGGMRGGIRGGMGGGMGVVIESGSPDRYINPVDASQIAGCRSDNTRAIGAYQLNTPLAVGGQRGGGQVCTESPYKFLQNGGRDRKGGKGRKVGKMSRRMKGGDGSFWNFAKFWSPSQPEQGGNVIPLSNRGISPAGIGAPVSTAANRPIPPIQSWPAQKLILPHDYTKGGAQVGGGGGRGAKRTARKGRKMKGAGILQDVENLGRSISHGFGSLVNGLSGYSNQLYNTNPNPAIQFPRGLGNEKMNQYQFTETDLKNVYNAAYATSASL
jgi:hypothetical protein